MILHVRRYVHKSIHLAFYWQCKYSSNLSTLEYKKSITNSYFFYLLSTRSWALLFAFPEVNSTTPLMSGEVCLRVSLWTVPIFSRRTRELGWSGSPFRLHTGALRTGTETSHSKQASPGAVTSTSFSSLTINTDLAESVHKREGKLLAYNTYFLANSLMSLLVSLYPIIISFLINNTKWWVIGLSQSMSVVCLLLPLFLGAHGITTCLIQLGHAV